jgi:hypothetical protein
MRREIGKLGVDDNNRDCLAWFNEFIIKRERCDGLIWLSPTMLPVTLVTIRLPRLRSGAGVMLGKIAAGFLLLMRPTTMRSARTWRRARMRS